MKHKPEMVSAEALADRIFREVDDPENHDFDSVVDDDYNLLEVAEGKQFVLVWPEHSITRQYLGDASIHGPYDSPEEAKEYHPGME